MGQMAEGKPQTAREKLFQMAAELDATLTTMCAALAALTGFMDLGNEPILSLPERIHYQTGALEMADELATFAPLIQAAIPKLQRQLLAIQAEATTEATEKAPKAEQD